MASLSKGEECMSCLQLPRVFVKIYPSFSFSAPSLPLFYVFWRYCHRYRPLKESRTIYRSFSWIQIRYSNAARPPRLFRSFRKQLLETESEIFTFSLPLILLPLWESAEKLLSFKKIWTRKDKVGQERPHFSQNFSVLRFFIGLKVFVFCLFTLSAAESQGGHVEHSWQLPLSMVFEKPLWVFRVCLRRGQPRCCVFRVAKMCTCTQELLKHMFSGHLGAAC